MKRLLFVLLLSITSSLTACSGEQTDSLGRVDFQETGSGVEYHMETDDQPDAPDDTVYTENGYYTLLPASGMNPDMNGLILRYFDYESGQKIPVCGKPDCDHNNEGCNAYFDGDTYPVPLDSLWYYEQNLYIFCVKQDYFAIERVSMDGSERETSCTLFRTMIESGTDGEGVSFSSTFFPEVMIHRGYAWFSTYYPGCEECCLYRVRLDSSDPVEELCVQEGEYPILYRLKGYGGNVYFQMGNFIDEEGTQTDISLYECSLATGEVTQVAENIVRNYTVGDNCIYYFGLAPLDSVMMYNLDTGETKQIRDSGGNEALEGTCLFVKDRNLYYSTSSFQYVYDSKGEQIGTLKDEDMVVPYDSGD